MVVYGDMQHLKAAETLGSRADQDTAATKCGFWMHELCTVLNTPVHKHIYGITSSLVANISIYFKQFYEFV